MYAYTENTAVA